MFSIRTIIIGMPFATLVDGCSCFVRTVDDIDIIVVGRNEIQATDDELRLLASQIKLHEARKRFKEEHEQILKELDRVKYETLVTEGDLPSCSYAENSYLGNTHPGFKVLRSIYRPRDNPP